MVSSKIIIVQFIIFFPIFSIFSAGNYTREKPPLIQLPGAGYYSENVKSPLPTTDWFASLVFDSTSNVMFGHPFAFKCEPDGIWIGYPNKSFTSVDFYTFSFNKDIKVSISDLKNQKVLLDNYSDWCATASWRNGDFKATMGHGLPFTYFNSTSGISIETAVEPILWYNSDGSIGLTVGDRHYGLFAPTGAKWSVNGKFLTSNLDSKTYFSIAALPDTQNTTFTYFRKFAYNFITDTRVSWSYNADKSTVSTVYESKFDKLEGNEANLLYALYPHQWQCYNGPFTTQIYNSVCGPMKVIEAPSFTTTTPYYGILPALPLIAKNSKRFNQQHLQSMIDEEQAKTPDQLIRSNGDTYWTGKDFGRTSMLVRIAEQVGDTTARDRFLTVIKSKLEDWFTYTSGETAEFFFYDTTWGTLIGVNAAYDSDKHINDHHFHYGYFVMAAATIAQYDKAWAKEWKPMVDLVIRDANSPSRQDTMFPFLRAFDIYAGHCWASGDAEFASGNNQESTSESVNISAGIALWGLATSDTVMRDLGIFLYATETAALRNYWLDINNIVFPADFNHSMVGIVWGEKADYGTWFSAEPECIHGINMLPVTAASLYLGRNPSYIQKNYDEIILNNNGPVNDWKDIIWEFLALAQGDIALTAYEADTSYIPESGESKAHTYHWLHNLYEAGQVDGSIYADVPCYSVFTKNNRMIYVVYNEKNTDQKVSFSNGANFIVPGNTLTFKTSDEVKTILEKQSVKGDNGTISFNNGQLFFTNSKKNSYTQLFVINSLGKKVAKFTDISPGKNVLINFNELKLGAGYYSIILKGKCGVVSSPVVFLK